MHGSGKFKTLLLTGALGGWLLIGLDCANAQNPSDRQFSSKAGLIVTQSIEASENQGAQAAIFKLDEALTIPNLSAYERSTIYSMLGSHQNDLEDYQAAIFSFENAIKSGGLSAEESNNLDSNIGLLLIANGQYSDGADRIDDWIARTGNSDPKYGDYIMQARIQAQQFSKALPWAEKWFESADPKEREHFDLMNFLYNKLDRKGDQSDIVMQMIEHWPDDRSLWDNWISLLAQGGREQDAFEVNKMLYYAGRLKTEQEIKKIVEYHQYYGMPYDAALILEKEMDAGSISVTTENLIRLSELFRQAREYERALPILKLAAEQSGRAKIWAQYGEALYNEGQCEASETALKKAMNLGYQQGKSWMLIANCRYEDGQKEKRPECDINDVEAVKTAPKYLLNVKALEAFRRVPVTANDYGAAKKWLEFVTNENKTYDKCCQDIIDIRRDECMYKIEITHQLVIIKGAFELSEKDAHCSAYVDEYDRLYRKTG